MHAVIHYVIIEVMALSDESSKFIDVISNFHRLEHISCLGSACNMRTFLEFPLEAIKTAKWLSKIDITLRTNFSVFTVIDVKVSFVSVNHVGNVFSHKHVHAAINWIIA